MTWQPSPLWLPHDFMRNGCTSRWKLTVAGNVQPGGAPAPPPGTQVAGRGAGTRAVSPRVPAACCAHRRCRPLEPLPLPSLPRPGRRRRPRCRPAVPPPTRRGRRQPQTTTPTAPPVDVPPGTPPVCAAPPAPGPPCPPDPAETPPPLHPAPNANRATVRPMAHAERRERTDVVGAGMSPPGHEGTKREGPEPVGDCACARLGCVTPRLYKVWTKRRPSGKVRP